MGMVAEQMRRRQEAFQRQQGYRFRDYALLTGMYREIGGVQLEVGGRLPMRLLPERMKLF